MATIDNLLAQMLSAVHGKDLRQSIHDAIQQCHDDTNVKRYYKPSVQSNGTLSWTRSHDNLPAIESTNIKGPMGDPGTTPIKGVNYLTDSDKNEMLQYTLNSSDLVDLITKIGTQDRCVYKIRVDNHESVQAGLTYHDGSSLDNIDITVSGNAAILPNVEVKSLYGDVSYALPYMGVGTYVYLYRNSRVISFDETTGECQTRIYINDVEVTLDDFIETGDDLFPYAYKVSDAPGGITRPSDARWIYILYDTIDEQSIRNYYPFEQVLGLSSDSMHYSQITRLDEYSSVMEILVLGDIAITIPSNPPLFLSIIAQIDAPWYSDYENVVDPHDIATETDNFSQMWSHTFGKHDGIYPNLLMDLLTYSPILLAE